MKNVRQFFIALPVIAVFYFTSPAAAQTIPNLINYQGRLTGANGSPLPSAQYAIQFRLWDSDTNTGTSDLVWGQQQTVAVQTNGVFGVILGASGGTGIPNVTPAVNDLSFAFTQSSRFMGLTIVASNGVNIANANEILPRQQILSVPYSVMAETAVSVLNSPVPSGLISMWSGSTTNIPAGWALCNGSNGTPDLRNRFVVGADENQGGVAMTSIEGSPLQIGGRTSHNHGGSTAAHTLTIAEMPSHNHSIYVGVPTDYGGPYTLLGNPSTSDTYISFTSNSQGGDQPHSHGISSDMHIPPYYALAFIIKL